MAGSPRLARALLAGAVAMAAAGITTAIVRDDEDPTCAALARRLEPYLSDEPTQSWDDIYTLQEDLPAAMQARHDFDAADCASSTTTSTRPPAATTTTTTPRPSDPRLLSAADLGPDFVDQPYRPDDLGSPACDVVLPEAEDRVGASYSSQPALELADVDLHTYASEAEAAAAFDSGRAASRCLAEGNLGDAGPSAVDVAGADEAFTIDFANSNDGVGSTVARSGSVIVVTYAQFHNGAATTDGIGTTDLAAQQIAHLHARQ